MVVGWVCASDFGDDDADDGPVVVVDDGDGDDEDEVCSGFSFWTGVFEVALVSLDDVGFGEGLAI